MSKTTDRELFLEYREACNQLSSLLLVTVDKTDDSEISAWRNEFVSISKKAKSMHALLAVEVVGYV